MRRHLLLLSSLCALVSVSELSASACDDSEHLPVALDIVGVHSSKDGVVVAYTIRNTTDRDLLVNGRIRGFGWEYKSGDIEVVVDGSRIDSEANSFELLKKSQPHRSVKGTVVIAHREIRDEVADHEKTKAPATFALHGQVTILKYNVDRQSFYRHEVAVEARCTLAEGEFMVK